MYSKKAIHKFYKFTDSQFAEASKFLNYFGNNAKVWHFEIHAKHDGHYNKVVPKEKSAWSFSAIFLVALQRISYYITTSN